MDFNTSNAKQKINMPKSICLQEGVSCPLMQEFVSILTNLFKAIGFLLLIIFTEPVFYAIFLFILGIPIALVIGKIIQKRRMPDRNEQLGILEYSKNIQQPLEKIKKITRQIQNNRGRFPETTIQINKFKKMAKNYDEITNSNHYVTKNDNELNNKIQEIIGRLDNLINFPINENDYEWTLIHLDQLSEIFSYKVNEINEKIKKYTFYDL